MYPARESLKLNPSDRAELVMKLLTALAESVPGSTAAQAGSLARGESDRFSDIDLLWDVPPAAFPPGASEMTRNLATAGKVESIRSDPEFAHSPRRRRLFIRLAGVSLFWRVDLSVRAVGEAETRGPLGLDEPGWSPAESALMNAVAAVKAHLRGHDARAAEILRPGYERIGRRPPEVPLRNQVLALVEAAALDDPGVSSLAIRVADLVPLAW